MDSGENILPGLTNNMPMTETLRCVDLFAGAGGFSLGFEQTKSYGKAFEVIAAVDKSASALETYEHNFQTTEIFEQDIKNFGSEILESRTGFTPSDVDVVIGGPPCKGFSLAGQLDPNDPRNRLVIEYANTVEELDPDVVVMENVTGFTNLKNGQYFEELKITLEEKGYNVQEPKLPVAAQYGVPQLRTRVIIIATKQGHVELPEPTHSCSEIDDSRDELSDYVTVGDAISDLAYLDYGEESSEYKLSPESNYQEEMRKGSTKLYNHKAPNHGERVRTRFSKFSQGDEMDDIPTEFQTKKHSQMRWDSDNPSPTVTTLPEDFIHYSKPRIPTVREIARIQSFPDWFEFRGPRTTGGSRRQNEVPQYSQVGNAVPPKLASAIAEGVQQHMSSTKLTPET